MKGIEKASFANNSLFDLGKGPGAIRSSSNYFFNAKTKKKHNTENGI